MNKKADVLAIEKALILLLGIIIIITIIVFTRGRLLNLVKFFLDLVKKYLNF